MKKKLLALTLPVGLIIELIYLVGNRFFLTFPDAVAYPMMIVSIVLMLVGVAYSGYCFGKGKSPFNFKE